MKCTVIIDEEREEETVIYAHSYSDSVKEIERIARHGNAELVGYDESGNIYTVPINEILYFSSENGKVFAITAEKKLKTKERLYSLEEMLGNRFIKINQSCIANLDGIEKFHVSLGAALKVVFKNGNADYVSRRQLKNVKNKLGI